MTTVEYERRRDKWPAKHRREFAAVHDNLDTLLGTLNEGVNPEQAKRQFGFLHSNYPKAILSIDQKGAGSGVKQTRLYVYADVHDCNLYLLILGDKATQSSDVAFCKQWVDGHLRSKKSNPHE